MGGPVVWGIDLADELAAADLDLLDDAERERAGRYADPVHGARFGTARAVGKRIVGRALGVDPQGVVFDRRPGPACGSAEHGPPAVEGAGDAVHISASRCGPMAMLAISDRAVGVDVERRRPLGGLEALAGEVLTPLELAAVMSAGPQAEREAAFLRCWTRKEAVLKAAGIGIAASLRMLEVHPEDVAPVVVSGPAEVAPCRWQVTDLHLDGGATFAAVAQPADGPGPVTYRRWCERRAP
jgi:4'-phosphopantetheinyl transferase